MASPTPSVNAIITTTEYRQIIKSVGTLVTEETDKIQWLINSVSGLLERDTGRYFKSQTVTSEKHSGARLSNRSFIYTIHHPIVTVTTLTEDGNTLTVDVDFTALKEEGKIVRVGSSSLTVLVSEPGNWNYGWENIVVTYNAGYATIPDDIKTACAYTVKSFYDGPVLGSIDAGSVGVAGQSLVFEPSAIPKHAKAIIDTYAGYSY